MNTLFTTWISCFRMLTISRIKQFFLDGGIIFFQALKQLVQTLAWFLITDIVLFALVGDVLLKALKIKADGSHQLGGLVVFLLLAVSVLSFIINTAFLLFIRRSRDDIRRGMDYLKETLFRYIQLSLFFSVFVFLVLIVLLGFGITKFPTVHWAVFIPIRMIELLTVFFWLDSSFRFRDLWISCERAANFFLYNLPLMIFLFCIGWSFDILIKLIVFGKTGITDLTPILRMRFDMVAHAGMENMTSLQMLFFKYIKLITDHLWIAWLFVLYNRWKDRRYTESFFEE